MIQCKNLYTVSDQVSQIQIPSRGMFISAKLKKTASGCLHVKQVKRIKIIHIMPAASKMRQLNINIDLHVSRCRSTVYKGAS